LQQRFRGPRRLDKKYKKKALKVLGDSKSRLLLQPQIRTVFIERMAKMGKQGKGIKIFWKANLGVIEVFGLELRKSNKKKG
jgi:hypothetical protein